MVFSLKESGKALNTRCGERLPRGVSDSALRRDERVDTAEVVTHRILKTGRGAGGQTVRKREGQGFPGGIGDVSGGRKRKEQRRKPYERTRRKFKEAFASVAFARGSCKTDGFDGDRFRTFFRQSPAEPLGFE